MSSQQLVDFIHEHIHKVSAKLCSDLNNVHLRRLRYLKQNKKCLQENSLSAVCERELDRCLAPSTMGGDGCDNMTMILVQFKNRAIEKKKADLGEQSAKGEEGSEIQ